MTAEDRGRFAVFGEPLVAVDVINTIAVPGSPVPDDLLSDPDYTAGWCVSARRDGAIYICLDDVRQPVVGPGLA